MRTVMRRITARYLGLSVLIGLIVFMSDSIYAQNKIATCSSIASQMNRSLPASIDWLTTLQSVKCNDIKGEVSFQYFHTITDPSALPRDANLKAKAAAKAQYCGNSDFRNALKLFNFDFLYFDSSNRPLHSFTLKASDC